MSRNDETKGTLNLFSSFLEQENKVLQYYTFLGLLNLRLWGVMAYFILWTSLVQTWVFLSLIDWVDWLIRTLDLLAVIFCDGFFLKKDNNTGTFMWCWAFRIFPAFHSFILLWVWVTLCLLTLTSWPDHPPQLAPALAPVCCRSLCVHTAMVWFGGKQE